MRVGLIISIFPFIRTWMEYNRVLPFLGNIRIHPHQTSNNLELASVSYAKEETSKQNLSKKIKHPEKKMAETSSPHESISTEDQQPDIIRKAKFSQPSGE
ncbi:kinocilin [Narcine bancroftii]|uniref:kinocilin n=1 Tax=Narcine bancroftii TaxID=1343680 RepID=UPI003831BB84